MSKVIAPMVLASIAIATSAQASVSWGNSFTFAGYVWEKKTGLGGPGPNNWDASNVTVDTSGALHLKMTKRNGKWYCPEVRTVKRLGFGKYQFWVVGRLDTLDKNVAVGLFNYPDGIAPDGTNEIDIEFSRWGNATALPGNYTLWPTKLGPAPVTFTFPFFLSTDQTTQRFTWKPQSVWFQSLRGLRNDDSDSFKSWYYNPFLPQVQLYIPQQPLRIHMNLWCVNGIPPSNGKEVEIVIKAFTFAPQ